MTREAVGPWPSPAHGPGPTPPGPLPEGETEAMSNAQRSTLKWEKEETLGELATVAPVLYTNINFPNLKEEYPGMYMALKLPLAVHIYILLLLLSVIFLFLSVIIDTSSYLRSLFCSHYLVCLLRPVGMTVPPLIPPTDWSTRVKQIAKLWRKASSQDRAPYVVRLLLLLNLLIFLTAPNLSQRFALRY